MWGVVLGFVSTQAKHSGFRLDGDAHTGITSTPTWSSVILD
jgi:hypothetical protein